MTLYQCISCKTIWNDEKNNIDALPGAEYSHGLCKPCARQLLKKKVRMKQMKEGNFDCFCKADQYCDQSKCAYREICLNI